MGMSLYRKWDLNFNWQSKEEVKPCGWRGRIICNHREKDEKKDNKLPILMHPWKTRRW